MIWILSFFAACKPNLSLTLFQVLMGDLKPAIETHEMLYEVAKRYKFIPEVYSYFKDTSVSSVSFV